MKKIMKKLAFPLIFAMLLTVFTGTGAFAEGNSSTQAVTVTEDGKEMKVKTVKDNKNVRIVEGENSKATFDKKTNVLTIENEGQEPIVIDLSEEQATPDPEPVMTLSFNSTSGENTFSNYEYDIDQTQSPDMWELRRPQPDSFNSTYYKRVKDTSSTSSELDKFKAAVEDINTLEWQFIGYNAGVSITTAVTVILTAVTAGGAISTGLVALGLTGKALDTALQLGERCEDAHYWYFSV